MFWQPGGADWSRCADAADGLCQRGGQTLRLAAVTFLISAGGWGFGPGGKQPVRESIIKKGKNFLCSSEKIFLNCDTSQN